jgi:hypothetical protein
MRAAREGISETDSTGAQMPEHDLKEALYEPIKIACYTLILPVWRGARRWRSKTVHTLNQ